MTLRNLNAGNISLNDRLLTIKSRLRGLAEELAGPVPPTPAQAGVPTPTPPTPPDVISQMESTMGANHEACDSIMNIILHLEGNLSLRDDTSATQAKLSGSIGGIR